ncbi:MAG: cation:proton antiporter [Planctomycetes bacterium]|nr:cation:proton antiporter [Planctomycetota bacterium]
MKLSADEIVRLLLALAVLVASARLLGEIARKFNQPAVIGELLAGLLLGPTVLGRYAPEAMQFLFLTGHVPVVLDGFSTLAICLFLLVAGMEVDLSTMFRQGKLAIGVGLSSMILPFALGFGLAGLIGPAWLGGGPNADSLLFALFMAVALSISALPVIAKTLLDLDMYRSELGMVIVAAAIFNDLVGWIIFAVVLSLMAGGGHHRFEITQTIGLTLGFAAFMLTIGRWLIHWLLPWLQAHLSWPGGVLGVAMTLTLAGAAFTEWIGVHAIFGSFLVGVALGDSHHLRERTRSTIDQFVSFIFAPIFFASIGLKVDFVGDFNGLLVAFVLIVSCVGKVMGAGYSAYKLGMPPKEAWAVGFGLNARGAMEIILGLLALQAGLINSQMFVALVIMALVTSMIAGPLMQRTLRRKKPKPFTDYVGARSFIPDLKASDREAAIIELVPVSGAQGVPLDEVALEVIARERMTPTGLGMSLALPHARIEGLKAPQVAVGISRQGLDFDAKDGEPAHIIVLILTPASDTTLSLELYREVVHRFKDPELRERLLKVRNYTEFLALLASAPGMKSATHMTTMISAPAMATRVRSLFKE